MNLYGYVLGNPVSYIDPLGLKYAEFLGSIGAWTGYVIGTSGAAAATIGSVGLNAPAIPAEVGAATALGGATGYGIGMALDWLLNEKAEECPKEPSSGERPSKTPNKGEPGSVYTNPGSGQIRTYGPDGKPIKDIDSDHDHGQGVPHQHDWVNGVRGPGKPVTD